MFPMTMLLQNLYKKNNCNDITVDKRSWSNFYSCVRTSECNYLDIWFWIVPIQKLPIQLKWLCSPLYGWVVEFSLCSSPAAFPWRPTHWEQHHQTPFHPRHPRHWSDSTCNISSIKKKTHKFHFLYGSKTHLKYIIRCYFCLSLN